MSQPSEGVLASARGFSRGTAGSRMRCAASGVLAFGFGRPSRVGSRKTMLRHPGGQRHIGAGDQDGRKHCAGLYASGQPGYHVHRADLF